MSSWASPAGPRAIAELTKSGLSGVSGVRLGIDAADAGRERVRAALARDRDEAVAQGRDAVDVGAEQGSRVGHPARAAERDPQLRIGAAQ